MWKKRILSSSLSSPIRGALLLLGAQLALLALISSIFPLRMWILRQAIPTDYFDPEIEKPDAFEHVNGALYAFRHGLNRSAILDTGEGLAVFDTYSSSHAARLRAAVRAHLPGKRVRWVFYSHNHLDHIRGASELAPDEVIAHQDVMSYVSDWENSDILPVTRALAGDAELVLGDQRVRLLYLSRSHSETLYAYHFPEQRAVFAPDAAFVRTLPPFGLPDWYYPGYIRGLDRIAALDFDHCITSHFELGNKQDFLDFRQMMIDFRRAGEEVVHKMHGEPSSGKKIRENFGDAYVALHAKYGSWRGFDAMFVPHFVGQVGGTYLGY